MGSSRLPGKVLAEIERRAMIDHVLARTARATTLDAVWLATSETAIDDPLAQHVDGLGFPVFRGSESDVLARYVGAAKAANAETVVRITGDCPLIDPAIIDDVVKFYRDGQADFASNTGARSFPDGLDVEVFSRFHLEQADRQAAHPLLRQHVTPWLSGVFEDEYPHGHLTTASLTYEVDFSHIRWCVDNSDDLQLVRRLLSLLPDGFGWLDAVAVMTAHPELLRMNRKHDIWEGVNLDQSKLNSSAQEDPFQRSNQLFERASKVIPLASQTFSKSHQMYVRGAAPLFIEHGTGCKVIDADNNSYIDYVLGLLPVVLGYRDPGVDAAIQDQLENGITFSLPSPLECEVAERLVSLIPSADMVRFGKNGSDATTAAIRLARAYTNRDKIVVCGYHGWHDWYIGTTVRDAGVPGAVKALSLNFPYNDADALAEVLAAHSDEVAAVIMEPHGLLGPEPGFLDSVRRLTQHHGVVLIFDEIVSGFRSHLGGAQALYGVEPDLTCVGKGMGNGMPISAVVGPKTLMTLMETIFFSGTFGGETLSLAAAAATLDRMQEVDLPSRLTARGSSLMKAANVSIASHGLGDALAFKGAPWWPIMSVLDSPVESNLFVSLLRQAFVENGLILAASFNLCLAHDDDLVEAQTVAALDQSFEAVATAVNAPDPARYLRGALVEPTFQVRKSA